MNFKTHHVAGLVATEATLLQFGQAPLSLVTPIALIGGYFISILSDIDKPTSVIGQKLWIVSRSSSLLHIRHRTLTHSLLFTFLLWLFLKALPIPEVLVWSLIMAFCSHWFIDMFNEHGVELLWPLPIRFKILPGFLAISSDDSIGQLIFRWGLILVQLILLLALLHPIILKTPIIGSLLDPSWSALVSYVPGPLKHWFH